MPSLRPCIRHRVCSVRFALLSCCLLYSTLLFSSLLFLLHSTPLPYSTLLSFHSVPRHGRRLPPTFPPEADTRDHDHDGGPQWNTAEKTIRKASPNFAEMLKRDPAADDGVRAPRPGEIMKNPTLAQTFRTLAREGKKGFYTGRIAEELVRVCRDLGGRLELDDLAPPPGRRQRAGRAHLAQVPRPRPGRRRRRRRRQRQEAAGRRRARGGAGGPTGGVELWEHPPNGQGIVALMALGIIQELEKQGTIPTWTARDHNTAPYLHAVIEALRLAFADASWYVTDPAVPAGAVGRARVGRVPGRARAAVRPGAGGGAHGARLAAVRVAGARQQRHRLLLRGGPARQRRLLHQQQLRRLRHLHRAARLRLHAAEPRRQLQPRRPPPQPAGAAQAALPHHHPGARHQPARRVAAQRLRRHGRLHAAPGPRAGAPGPARRPPRPAAGPRRPARVHRRRPCPTPAATCSTGPSTSRTACPTTSSTACAASATDVVVVSGDRRGLFGRGQVIRRSVDPVENTVVWSAGSDMRGDGAAYPV